MFGVSSWGEKNRAHNPVTPPQPYINPPATRSGTLNQFWKNLYATNPLPLIVSMSSDWLIKVLIMPRASLTIKSDNARELCVLGGRYEGKSTVFAWKLWTQRSQSAKWFTSRATKKDKVFAPRLELGTSRVWGERHNQLDHANRLPSLQRGSNSWPSPYEGDALPTEL